MLEAVRRRFDLGMLVMYILHFFFGFGFLLGFHWLLLAVIIQSDYRDFCKIVERLGDRELHLEFSDVSQDEFPIEEQRQVIRDLKHYRVIALINCFSYHLMNIVYWSMHLALSLRLYACPTQFGIAPTCVENASGGVRLGINLARGKGDAEEAQEDCSRFCFHCTCPLFFASFSRVC